MSAPGTGAEVRLATSADAGAAARLLHDFNAEFDVPTPGTDALTKRLIEVLGAGAASVLLVGDGPEGIAVLRFRPAIFHDALDAYLEELYVVPARRGEGLGRRLLEAALDHARERGAARMELGTDEGDVAAHGLYRSLGFSNRNDGGESGELMYFFERDL